MSSLKIACAIPASISGLAYRWISQNGMANRHKMHPQLMRSTGKRFRIHPRPSFLLRYVPAPENESMRVCQSRNQFLPWSVWPIGDQREINAALIVFSNHPQSLHSAYETAASGRAAKPTAHGLTQRQHHEAEVPSYQVDVRQLHQDKLVLNV